MVEAPIHNPDALQLPVRQDMIGEKPVQTNLPKGADAYFPASARQPSLLLKVDKVDQLPVGSYQTTHEWETMRDPDNPDAPTSGTARALIEVMQTEKGKAIRMLALDDGDEDGYTIDSGRQSLYEQLGYVTQYYGDEFRVIAYPTPQTLIQTAGDFGLNIYIATQEDLVISRFVDSSGDIKSRPYLEAFKNGMYPISAYSEYSYTHDSDQTHLLGLVFGGDELMTELGLASARALDNPDLISQTTGGIDGITAGLQRLILAGSSRQRSEGEGAFKYFASQIGITPEKTDQILTAAKRRAQILGIQLPKLSDDPEEYAELE